MLIQTSLKDVSKSLLLLRHCVADALLLGFLHAVDLPYSGLFLFFQWLIQLYGLLGDRDREGLALLQNRATISQLSAAILYGEPAVEIHLIALSMQWCSSSMLYQVSGKRLKTSQKQLHQDCYLHCLLYILELKNYFRLELTLFSYHMSNQFNPFHLFHMIGFTESVSMSASLPTFSTHVSLSIIHRLSFPLHPFHFTVCPLCDLGPSGRHRDGHQAAVEIWFMT